MIEFLKKSLRAKFTLLLLVVGVFPLLCMSAFFYYTARDAFFRNVFKELNWNVDEIAVIVENLFADAGKNLLFASQNAAFRMYYIEPGRRGYWLAEQKKTLRYINKTYPDIVDEACFVDSSGMELASIVHDRIVPKKELLSDEQKDVFFRQALLLGDGEVYQGRPMISEETNRWVIPNATPVAVHGVKKGVLHFEVTMNYFQLLLRRHINPHRGYAFIMNAKGEFMANTQMEISQYKPFPDALTADTPAGLERIYRRMMKGERGIESFRYHGKEYYIIFRPVNLSYVKGRNDNRWSIGYVISSDRVYVELAILRYNIIAIGATSFFVLIIAYVTGNYITRPIRELAVATRKVAGGEMPMVSSAREDEIGQLSVSFNMMAEAVKRRNEALKSLAVTDGLTGLYNQSHFKAELEKAVKLSGRYGRPLTLFMADVDFFKQYNDTNGHVEGDMALKRIAGVFLRTTREVDVAARYGGEEFALMLQETSLADAMKLAERIRAGIEAEAIPFETMQPHGKLTISIGVATYPEDADSPLSLIDAADKALYMAKRNGKNRVEAYGGGV